MSTSSSKNSATLASIWAKAEGQGNVDLFEWQWQFWIAQDMLMALTEANRQYASVVEAPVKRLVSMTVLGDVAADFPCSLTH